MNRAMYAVLRKDFRGIVSNRRLFLEMLLVPLVLTIILPSIFVAAVHFARDDPDMVKLIGMLPAGNRAESAEMALAGLIFNYILPVFFLMVPIMTASVMAASSFVGEKEKHTLETLLYCPLSVKQIFQAKVLASFLFSMLVSLISFIAMMAVLETEMFFVMGSPVIPAAGWLVILLFLAPSVSLIAVTLIVRGSAKAQSVEESQQGAAFLIIPVILLVAGQFAGIMLLNVWILLGLSAVCMLLAWVLLQKAVGRFNYETLLK